MYDCDVNVKHLIFNSYQRLGPRKWAGKLGLMNRERYMMYDLGSELPIGQQFSHYQACISVKKKIQMLHLQC